MYILNLVDIKCREWRGDSQSALHIAYYMYTCKAHPMKYEYNYLVGFSLPIKIIWLELVIIIGNNSCNFLNAPKRNSLYAYCNWTLDYRHTLIDAIDVSMFYFNEHHQQKNCIWEHRMHFYWTSFDIRTCNVLKFDTRERSNEGKTSSIYSTGRWCLSIYLIIWLIQLLI